MTRADLNPQPNRHSPAPALELKGIALDLDGTLLRNDHSVDPQNAAVLSHAAERGVHVILLSARPPRSVLEYAEVIGSRHPIVALNGALCVDHAHKTLFEMGMNREAVQNALALCDACPELVWNVYHGFSWQVPRVESWVRQESEIIGFEPDAVLHRSEVAGAEKLLICGPDEPLLSYMRQLSELEPSLILAISKAGYLEVTAPGVSKASGLRRYAALAGLQEKNFAAVGDGMNDVCMLTAAGLGVAMGNAGAAVKARASLVIGDNQSAAIAELVVRLFP